MALNMDEKVQLKNLCDWVVSFKRIDGVGDILINANSFVRVPRSEVYAQVESNNNMITGLDGMGSHARVFIADKDTRIDLGFEDEKKSQNILDDDKIKELFAIKTKAAFEKAVEEAVVTNAEKAKIVAGVKKNKLNEYDKIRFISEYTGMSIN